MTGVSARRPPPAAAIVLYSRAPTLEFAHPTLLHPSRAQPRQLTFSDPARCRRWGTCFQRFESGCCRSWTTPSSAGATWPPRRRQHPAPPPQHKLPRPRRSRPPPPRAAVGPTRFLARPPLSQPSLPSPLMMAGTMALQPRMAGTAQRRRPAPAPAMTQHAEDRPMDPCRPMPACKTTTPAGRQEASGLPGAAILRSTPTSWTLCRRAPANVAPPPGLGPRQSERAAAGTPGGPLEGPGQFEVASSSERIHTRRCTASEAVSRRFASLSLQVFAETPPPFAQSTPALTGRTLPPPQHCSGYLKA